MGKIRVADLARIMGIAEQDLVFKLRSIGVRVDEEHAEIDTETVAAILKGKKLPHPREVILRDQEAQETAPTPRRLPHRRPVGPRRPLRRRTLIQRVEPRIKTIPTSELRPAPTEATGSAEPAGERPQRRVPEAPPAAEKPTAAASGSPAPGAGRPRPEREPKVDRGEEEKRQKRARPESEGEEDLRIYRGSLEEIEAAEQDVEDREAGRVVSRRRRRRAERKQKAAAEGGKLLTFKKAAPVGPVTLTENMTVREFADKLGVKAKDLIQVLFERGIMASINHVLEPELASQVAEELGVEVREVTFEEDIQLQHEGQLEAEAGAHAEPRAPVVTIMGHVDHGKTTLLDALRSSNVTAGEFGGITQHIGAYQLSVNGRKIVFLDTPGHEAFTLMRARGAQATDIVVLVVAADDGVMQQTVEAIDHARAAQVPIVVAINKIDKANANLDRVKKGLAEQGLTPEDWGGDTVTVALSAKTQEGLPELLEMILLTADLLELKASPDLPAQGIVLEARKEAGRGVVATVLVQNGSLEVGDAFVSGATWGRVRAMTDDTGQRLQQAGPATPVEVVGFSDLPEAGDRFQVLEEESKARGIADFRRQEQRKKDLAPTAGKISLEQLFEQIEEGEVKELPMVLKADVQGSLEVLTDTLEKLSTDRVKVRIIRAGVGAITSNDVLLASASDAIIFGFNVRPERNATEIAEKEQVDIRLHTVIYELTDELRKAMTGLLEPTFREVSTGRAEVREIFNVPRAGTVAGCHVVEGVISRGDSVRLVRDGRVVYEGKIASLRRFKDDASEVRSGFDCGIRLERFQDVKPGDAIEAYVQEEVAPTL